MVGAIVFAVVMILALPVVIMVGGAIWSALFGWDVGDDVHRAHADDPA